MICIKAVTALWVSQTGSSRYKHRLIQRLGSVSMSNEGSTGLTCSDLIGWPFTHGNFSVIMEIGAMRNIKRDIGSGVVRPVYCLYYLLLDLGYFARYTFVI